MKLVRLVYISKRSELLNFSQIADLMEKASAKNQRLEITGMLLVSSDHFIQVLEGSEASVNTLFQTISQDKRHEEVILKIYKQIHKRMFSAWNMKSIYLLNVMKDYSTAIQKKYGFDSHRPIILPEDPDILFSLLYDMYQYSQE